MSQLLKVKVTTIGDSVGVILPDRVVAHLKIKAGDTLTLTETAIGYDVRPYDAEFEEVMAVARKVARKYRNALRELAKR